VFGVVFMISHTCVCRAPPRVGAGPLCLLSACWIPALTRPARRTLCSSQEPINAHSHLLSIMLGNTLTVPVTGGCLALGTWQSVMLVELDGPRARTVGLQVVGGG
jgi:hypothetical protein